MFAVVSFISVTITFAPKRIANVVEITTKIKNATISPQKTIGYDFGSSYERCAY
jgi:hypothetical protein